MSQPIESNEEKLNHSSATATASASNASGTISCASGSSASASDASVSKASGSASAMPKAKTGDSALTEQLAAAALDAAPEEQAAIVVKSSPRQNAKAKKAAAQSAQAAAKRTAAAGATDKPAAPGASSAAGVADAKAAVPNAAWGLTEAQALQQDFIRFLDCPCTYFAPMHDDEPIMQAYQQALAESKASGSFVPLLIVPSEVLYEILLTNSDPTCDSLRGDFIPAHVKRFRQDFIASRVVPIEKTFSELAELAQDEITAPLLLTELAEQDGGAVEPHTHFISYWNYDDDCTYPVILAKLPVIAHDVFAYLPFGGWNTCPSNEELRAVTAFWYQRYGAQPALMTEDSLEFMVPQPVAAAECKELALKHYVFCPSFINSSDGITISSHAEALKDSTIWYFWWE